MYFRYANSSMSSPSLLIASNLCLCQFVFIRILLSSFFVCWHLNLRSNIIFMSQHAIVQKWWIAWDTVAGFCNFGGSDTRCFQFHHGVGRLESLGTFFKTPDLHGSSLFIYWKWKSMLFHSSSLFSKPQILEQSHFMVIHVNPPCSETPIYHRILVAISECIPKNPIRMVVVECSLYKIHHEILVWP